MSRVMYTLVYVQDFFNLVVIIMPIEHISIYSVRLLGLELLENYHTFIIIIIYNIQHKMMLIKLYFFIRSFMRVIIPSIIIIISTLVPRPFLSFSMNTACRRVCA